MKKILTAIYLCMIYTGAQCQVSPEIKLSDTARVFGEGVISDGDFVFNAAFTPDSKTVYFSRSTINFGYIAIFYSTLQGSKWSKPQPVDFTGTYRDTDPFVSADGKRLYFASDRPVNGKPFVDYDYHYFYVELNGNKPVSEPVGLNLSLPDGIKPSYPSFADNGNIYFYSSDGKDADIYMCEYKNGAYLPPVSLSFNDKKSYDLDPIIAHDESFIIFASNNRKGYGGRDLWVSFKNGETWTDPVNMGSSVNTKGNDGAPSLSRDDKTLYFLSYREKPDRPVYKNGKITGGAIIDLMHSTKNGIPHIFQVSISDLKKSGI